MDQPLWTAWIVVLALAGALAGGARPAGAQTWNLVWSDEFDRASLDTGNWRFETGGSGFGNRELQLYTNGDNVSVAGGLLTITARRANAGSCWYGTCQYTSSRINTAGRRQFQYGRVEARIALPPGKGLWPAFWMLGTNIGTVGWPTCGELDIMEGRGSNPGRASSAIHGPGYFGATPFNHGTGISPQGFNIYSMEWDPNQVRFFVNGDVHYSVPRSAILQRGDWVFDQPFFIILNLAVGGVFDGDPTPATPFPAAMKVDYVRVYRMGPPPSGIDLTPDPNGVTASANDGNLPASAVDGSLDTRWSASGDGQWLQLALGSVRSVSFVKIAAYRGDQRRNRFDLEVSKDGVAWTTLLWGAQTSGSTTAEETFDLPDVAARYVRYVGHGATLNAGGTTPWNSLTEMRAFAP